MPQSFGSQLRLARERLGLTQEDVAKRAGFDKAHISNLERDKKQPSIAGVDRLAAALDMPPFDLVRGTQMAGKYAAERSSPNDQAIQAEAERRRRSAKIVAIHEVYRRIVQFFELHLWGHVLNGADAYGEAYLGYLAEALTEQCAAAVTEFGEQLNIREELFVPSSLDPSQYVFDGLLFENESQEYD
jgi:transcriptional regulator with XRE-family HTH domain